MKGNKLRSSHERRDPKAKAQGDFLRKEAERKRLLGSRYKPAVYKEPTQAKKHKDTTKPIQAKKHTKNANK
jgi:hypothetical protein